MQRLHIRAKLSPAAIVELDRGQTNYLVNVLRMRAGGTIRVFNGRDGEWRATLVERDRHGWALAVERQERQQTDPLDLHYLFAPLKQGRQDYMVQKAVEMGAGVMTPVLTQHGQVTKINTERLQANAIEAAEQCGLLSIPQINEPVSLGQLLESWPSLEPNRRMVFCDEGSERRDPLDALAGVAERRFAVLVGPEGGFSLEERARLRSRAFITPIWLGPRILRADTAAVAAIALVQAVMGDWRAVAGATG